MGAGQFCTKPGVAVVIAGPQANAFVAASAAAQGDQGPQTLLTGQIAASYRSGRDHMAASAGVRSLVSSGGDARLASPALGDKVFGPLRTIVVTSDFEQMGQTPWVWRGS